MSSKFIIRASTLGRKVSEDVEKCLKNVYLGKRSTLNLRNNFVREISRRKRAGWLKFDEGQEAPEVALELKDVRISSTRRFYL